MSVGSIFDIKNRPYSKYSNAYPKFLSPSFSSSHISNNSFVITAGERSAGKVKGSWSGFKKDSGSESAMAKASSKYPVASS